MNVSDLRRRVTAAYAAYIASFAPNREPRMKALSVGVMNPELAG
jgi:hypothetical protein